LQNVKGVFVRSFDRKQVIDGFLDSLGTKAPSVPCEIDCLLSRMVVNVIAMSDLPGARWVMWIE
jgi:hypothetical protein